ncbi:10922_t:CDS:2 [Entrophospora sp. SA101]|nr:10922_t:CDS:2 [Entrophospora sp. SA101]CAJ0835021.1 9682_t:CDS:2 [Entrophospora sp. SA101]
MEIQPATTKLNHYFSFNLKDIPTTTTSDKEIERRVIDEKIEICLECNHSSSGNNNTISDLKTAKHWCKKCNSERFQKKLSTWTSSNKEIDHYIKTIQFSATDHSEVIEWIPWNRFTDIRTIGTGRFGVAYSAIWLDGYITEWDNTTQNWARSDVKTKYIIKFSSHKNGVDGLIRCFGITQIPETRKYGLVIRCSQTEMQSYLYDSQPYIEHDWKTKLEILADIALTIHRLHEKNLFNGNLHTVATQLPPFDLDAHDISLAQRICCGLRLHINATEMPNSLGKLINRCWDANPVNRPEAEEVYIWLQSWLDLCSDPATSSDNIGMEFHINDYVKKKKKGIEWRHPKAIYTDRVFEFNNLPKPINFSPDTYHKLVYHYSTIDKNQTIKDEQHLSLSRQPSVYLESVKTPTVVNTRFSAPSLLPPTTTKIISTQYNTSPNTAPLDFTSNNKLTQTPMPGTYIDDDQSDCLIGWKEIDKNIYNMVMVVIPDIINIAIPNSGKLYNNLPIHIRTTGYYQCLTFLSIVVALSAIYQISQVKLLLSGSKWPELPDLPSYEEKFDTVKDNSDNNKNNTAIHFKITVWIYKILNYVLDYTLIGEISINEIILLVIFITLNLIFLYLPFQDGISTVPDLYNRSAYIALANAAFVFPLATRNSVFVVLFGVPFERLITFHRWVGKTIFLLLTFHGSYQMQQNFNSLSQIFLDKINLWGFLSYVSLFIIFLTSHPLFRRRFFEFFYWSHFNFIFFVIFGVLHNDNFSTFTCVGVGLYVIDRIIRSLIGYKDVKIISIEAMQANVTKVVFDFNYYYSAGQYMFINIPNLNQPTSLIAWHPISFSSSKSIINAHDDDHNSDNNNNMASFHMKSQGGFSNQFLDFAQYSTVVLIGGGIGVTPLISILNDLINRQLTNIPLKTQTIHFCWLIPHLDSYSWFELELQELISKSRALPNNKYLLNVKIFLTKSTTISTPLSSLFFLGRPDFNLLLRDVKQYNVAGDIAVGVCGPTIMRRKVRNASVIESDETCLFKVHYETFEL